MEKGILGKEREREWISFATTTVVTRNNQRRGSFIRSFINVIIRVILSKSAV